MEQPDPEEEKEDMKKNGDFYKAFNDWLERERQKISQPRPVYPLMKIHILYLNFQQSMLSY